MKSLEISISSKLDVISKELAVADLSKFSVTGFADMLADAENQLHESHRDLSKSIVSMIDKCI